MHESAEIVSMKLGIFGQTPDEQYLANPNMEPRETYQSKFHFVKIACPYMKENLPTASILAAAFSQRETSILSY